MIGHSLLFRYADVVFFLGGSELLLGTIVGVGMIGSLAMRLAQGVGLIATAHFACGSCRACCS